METEGSEDPLGHMGSKRYSRSPVAGLYLKATQVIPGQSKTAGCSSQMILLLE